MKYLLHAFFLLTFSAHIFSAPKKQLTIKDAPLDTDLKKCNPKFSVLHSEWAQQNPIFFGHVPVYKFSYVPDCLLAQRPPDFMSNYSRLQGKNRPTTFKLTNWYLQNELNNQICLNAPEHKTGQATYDKTIDEWSDQLKSLLKLGASVNALEYSIGMIDEDKGIIFFGTTSLTKSTRKQPAVTRLLLDNGAQVNPTQHAEQPLYIAAGALAGEENPEVVKMLLDAKAHVNAVCTWQKGTALHSASYTLSAETIKLLLEHHAQPSLVIKDRHGQTPIDRALLPKHCSPSTHNLSDNFLKKLLSVLLLLKSSIPEATCLPEVLQYIDDKNKWSYKQDQKAHNSHKIQKFLLFHGAPPQTEADKKLKTKIENTKKIFDEIHTYKGFIAPLQTMIEDYATPISEDPPLLESGTLLEKIVLADDFLTPEEIAELYKEKVKAHQSVATQTSPTSNKLCIIS